MSEIKFRAWDKANKKMLVPLSGILWSNPVVPTDYMQGLFDDTPSNYTYLLEGEMVMVSECEIMQYTSLKDKNGKEIYEGDILATPLQWFDDGVDLDQNEDERPKKNRVVTHMGIPIFYRGDWSISRDKVEVIGNIYEHPELLESKA